MPIEVVTFYYDTTAPGRQDRMASEVYQYCNQVVERGGSIVTSFALQTQGSNNNSEVFFVADIPRGTELDIDAPQPGTPNSAPLSS